MPVYSRRFSQPPPGSLVDRTHPLAQGLLCFYPLNEGAGGLCYDACQAGPALSLSSAATWSGGLSGGLLCAATGACASAVAPASLQLPGLTLAMGFRPVAPPSPANSRVGGIGFNSSFSSPFNAIIFQYVGSPLGQVNVEYNSGGTSHRNAILTQAVGTDYVFSSWIATGNQAAYGNGVAVAPSAFSGAITYGTNPPLFLGGGPGTSDNPNVLIYWMGLWSRQLGPPENASLYANPWQLFLPSASYFLFHAGSSIFNASASGGAVVGGSAGALIGFLATASGGTVLAGSAVPSARFSPVPSGGVLMGGSAVPGGSTFIASAAGGAVLGGSATVSSRFTASAAGGAVLGGSASGSSVFTASASGGAVVGGTGIVTTGSPVTLREAVRAWLVSQSSVTSVVGNGVYFAVPSQIAAYPCLVVMVPHRNYGHNLAGADGTSVATVEITALGLQESQCIAAIEAVRNFADGFRGPQSGISIMTCMLDPDDSERDPMPVAPPDGSDSWIYQATVDYRVKHRVPSPTSVTQTFG